MASSEDKIPLYKYFLGRFLSMKGSLFLEGLVGGMFLSFLLETEGDCDDKFFTVVFFIIGLSHFLCHIVENLEAFIEEALTIDGDATVTNLEVVIDWIAWVTLLVIRVVQYPMVVALGYYTIKFDLIEPGQWKHEMDENETEENSELFFCLDTFVQLAKMTFAFQIIIGIILFSLWLIMWAVDSEDDEDELRQESAWKKFEKNMASNWWGYIYETLLLISSQSFFNSGVASAMLALAIALPDENCHIAMKNFLIGGLIQTMIGALRNIRIRVEEMADLDGIINWAEYCIIQVLIFLHFPLFIVQFYCFVMLFWDVLSTYSTVTHNPEHGEEENYCAQGTWQFMIAVSGIYSVVFLFKVFVIIAMLIKRIKN